MIVANDRDRCSLAWLVERAGADAVREAVARIPGDRRPYVTNVARVLALELPRLLALPPTDSPNRRAVAEKLAVLRR